MQGEFKISQRGSPLKKLLPTPLKGSKSRVYGPLSETLMRNIKKIYSRPSEGLLPAGHPHIKLTLCYILAALGIR